MIVIKVITPLIVVCLVQTIAPTMVIVFKANVNV